MNAYDNMLTLAFRDISSENEYRVLHLLRYNYY